MRIAQSVSGFDSIWSIAKPQPLDRLGLLTLLLSIYFMQIWGFFLVDDRMWPADYHANLVLVGLSVLGVLVPRLFPIVVINCVFYVISYVIRSPISSNNQITALFASLVIIFGAVIAFTVYRSDGDGDADTDWRERIFDLIAGPGRFVLAGMYFYGIYHKINYDFLDPQVSCAVALYRTLMVDFNLQDWSVGHYAAIYGTFVVEGIAMVLLFSKRYKLLGIAIGIPFHIIIGWTGYAYYKDFSTIVLVLYAMFLPRIMLDQAYAAFSGWVGSANRALHLGRAALFVVVIAHLAYIGVFQDRTAFEPNHRDYVWFFTFYALTFYAVALAFVPWNSDKVDAPKWNRWSAMLCIFPLIYFINGASPYLGLKTESSIAMYSNVHTEGGQTNHLLTGAIPVFGSHLQEDLVVPISSNSERFTSKYIGEGLALVRYDLDRMLALDPGLRVTFEHDGTVWNSWEDGWDNRYNEYSLLQQKYFLFKPVDFNRPKQCSH